MPDQQDFDDFMNLDADKLDPRPPTLEKTGLAPVRGVSSKPRASFFDAARRLELLGVAVVAMALLAAWKLFA